MIANKSADCLVCVVAVATDRGLCKKHYNFTHQGVQSGKWTWQERIDAGLALPAKTHGRLPQKIFMRDKK